MHHQCKRGQRLGRDQRIRPLEDETLDLAAEIGGGFSLEQGVEGSRSPMLGGDLIVGAREGLDAAAYECRERFNRVTRVLALADHATDQPEYVSNAVVEFCDQELLALLS